MPVHHPLKGVADGESAEADRPGAGGTAFRPVRPAGSSRCVSPLPQDLGEPLAEVGPLEGRAAFIYNEEGQRITLSHKDCDTKAAAIFFEEMRNWSASQWSIYIPDPNPLWKESPDG